MSVGEQDPPLSEPVDVRCFCLRMAAHAADPIVEIINRNQQDIRFCGILDTLGIASVGECRA